MHQDQELRGVRLYLHDPVVVNLTSLQFMRMEVHHQMYPERNPFRLCKPQRHDMFDKVCGADQVRQRFTKRMVYADVEPFLNQDAENFRAKAKKYYKYP